MFLDAGPDTLSLNHFAVVSSDPALKDDHYDRACQEQRPGETKSEDVSWQRRLSAAEPPRRRPGKHDTENTSRTVDDVHRGGVARETDRHRHDQVLRAEEQCPADQRLASSSGRNDQLSQSHRRQIEATREYADKREHHREESDDPHIDSPVLDKGISQSVGESRSQ